MHAATVEINNMRVYMRRDDVELVHDGHAEQHSEHAVLPQQQQEDEEQQQHRCRLRAVRAGWQQQSLAAEPAEAALTGQAELLPSHAQACELRARERKREREKATFTMI